MRHLTVSLLAITQLVCSQASPLVQRGDRLHHQSSLRSSRTHKTVAKTLADIWNLCPEHGRVPYWCHQFRTSQSHPSNTLPYFTLPLQRPTTKQRPWHYNPVVTPHRWHRTPSNRFYLPSGTPYPYRWTPMTPSGKVELLPSPRRAVRKQVFMNPWGLSVPPQKTWDIGERKKARRDTRDEKDLETLKEEPDDDADDALPQDDDVVEALKLALHNLTAIQQHRASESETDASKSDAEDEGGFKDRVARTIGLMVAATHPKTVDEAMSAKDEAFEKLMEDPSLLGFTPGEEWDERLEEMREWRRELRNDAGATSEKPADGSLAVSKSSTVEERHFLNVISTQLRSMFDQSRLSGHPERWETLKTIVEDMDPRKLGIRQGKSGESKRKLWGLFRNAVLSMNEDASVAPLNNTDADSSTAESMKASAEEHSIFHYIFPWIN